MPTPDKTKLVDASEVTKNLTDVIRAFPAVADALVKQIALAIMAEAQRRAPKDRGDLRGSAVLRPQPDGSYIIAFTEPYAAAQHEHTEYHHDVGEAKYLEHALFAIGLGQMPREIAEKLVDELNRQVGHG